MLPAEEAGAEQAEAEAGLRQEASARPSGAATGRQHLRAGRESVTLFDASCRACWGTSEGCEHQLH